MAESVRTSRSGPSRFDRKARVVPSGEGSAWYSVAVFVRIRRASPPSAGISNSCQWPVRSELKMTRSPSGVNRAIPS